jgi:hypothetical protein
VYYCWRVWPEPGAAIVVALFTNSTEISKRKEVCEGGQGIGRKQQRQGEGCRGIEDMVCENCEVSGPCSAFFHGFCVVENWVLLLQMGTRNSTCNLVNFSDTVCGGWRRKGGEERRSLFWELIVMGLECGDTN